MKRRRKASGGDPTPARFLRADPADWPGGKDWRVQWWESYENWKTSLTAEEYERTGVVCYGPDVHWDGTGY